MSPRLLLSVLLVYLAVVANAAPAAKPAGKPAPKPVPKPAPKKVVGSVLNFNYGTLAVRPGCFLQALGKTKPFYEAHGPCGDEDDQGTWERAVKMWTAAGDSWVDMCTDKGKVKMSKGCPPYPIAIIKKVPFKAGATKWVQLWPQNPVEYSEVKAAFGGALLDVRKDTAMMRQSAFAFVDSFLYVAQAGILGLEKSLVYVEDNPDAGPSAAVLMDNGKIGLIGGQFILNNSLIALNKKSKFFLTKGANFKVVKGGFILKESAFLSDSSKMEFWDAQDIHIVRSTVNLTNTVLDLVRSNVYLWDSYLVLQNSQVNLNMSRILLSNAKIIGDGYVKETAEISENFGVNVGAPVDAMNVDFKVESEAGKIVMTGEVKKAVDKEKEEQIKTTAAKGRR